MKKRFAFFIIVLLLCSCAMSAFSESALALAASELESDSEKNEGDSDTSPYDIYISPSELLRIFVGDSVSDGEAKYLDGKSSLSFSYDVDFSSDSVRLILPKDSSAASVYANATPMHEAKNGVTVTWVPLYAEHEGSRADFAACDVGDYEYCAELPINSADGVVTVTYEGRLVFSKEKVNEITSFAYSAAVAAYNKIEEKNAEYEDLFAQFEARRALYEQYLADVAEYESKLDLYEAYIEECEAIQKEYDDALRKYEALMEEYEISKAEYKEKLDAYYADIEEYNLKLEQYDYYINVAKPAYDAEYQKYIKYLDEMDEYALKYEKYEEYRENADKYLAHLEILNTVKTPMTDGRTLYDAITGTTVTTVLERQDEIVAAGAPKELVDTAGLATKKLRAIFDAYFSCSTDEERYYIYKKYYKTLKDSLVDLLQALDYFYKMNGGTGLVYTKLTEEEKGKKYVILLSQLYIFASAISDEPVYDYSGKTRFTDSYTWTYAMSLADHNAGRRYTVNPIEMLEGERYLADTDSATPYTDPFPQYQDEPIKPVEVLKPEKPAECQKPKEPVMPEEPTPPKEVEAPQMPDAVQRPEEPSRMDDPGAAPQPYVPTDEERCLAELLNGGELAPRDERGEDFCHTLNYSISKGLVSSDEATVYFYSSSDYDELLYITVSEAGAPVSFVGTEPSKPSDGDNHYLFDGWADADGNRIDLGAVGSGHIYLHPIYKVFSKNDTFTVTWNIDGGEYVTYCKYGEIPSCSVIPKKDKDAEKRCAYIFDRWDSEPVPATSDATYTAIFSAVGYYEISWYADGKLFAVTECLETEIPTPPSEKPTKPDDDYGRYVFSGWSKEPERPTSDTSYEAEFDVIRYYTVTWLGADGEVLLETKCLETEIPRFTGADPTKPDDDYGRYVFSGWSKEPERPTSDTSYEAEFDVIRYYTVTWLGASGDVLLETKCLETEIPRFTGADPTKPDDGTYRYVFSGWDKEPECPTSDTEYAARFRQIRQYTVSWMSDGNLIEKVKCDEGAIPTPPQTVPTRPSDALYKYTFSGWSKASTAAESDAVYEAVFERNYIYPCGNGGAELTYSYGKLKISTVKCESSVIPDLTALAALAEDRQLVIEAPSGTVSISAKTLSAMLNDGVRKISVSSEGGEYSVTVEDENGAISEEKYGRYSIVTEFIATAPFTPVAGGTVHTVCIEKDGKMSIVESEIGENSFTVSEIKCNTVYKCVEFFDIKLFDGIDWISVKSAATEGERVELSVDLPLGTALKSIYYVRDDSDGDRVAITDGEFVMPRGGVWIFASLQPLEFNIKFIYYDGSYIIKTCKWGEVPVPTVIQSGVDSENVYTFVSWDKEIVAAYGDAEYTALYDVTKIDGGSYEKGSFWLLYLITVYRYRRLLTVSAVLSLASACIFVTTVIYKKRRRRF